MSKRRLAAAVLTLLLALALAAVTVMTGAKYVVSREGTRVSVVVTASSEP